VRTVDQEERVDGGKVGRVRLVIMVCVEPVSFSVVVLLRPGQPECHQIFSSITIVAQVRIHRFVLDERDQADGLLPPQESVHLDLEGPPGGRNRIGLEQTAEVHHIRGRLVPEVYLPEELKDVS